VQEKSGAIVKGQEAEINDRALALVPEAGPESSHTDTPPTSPFNRLNADSEQRAIVREPRPAHDGAFKLRLKMKSPLMLSDNEEKVGLHARTTLDESPDAMRQVRLAILRAKQGERDAIRLLYVRYAENVYGYVASILRDEKEAEDLTQHVFLKLITAIHKYDDRGVPFSAWLLRLARNAALDHLRRRRAIPAEEVFGVDSHVDEGTLDRARSLRTALNSLPEEQREVVVMRHVLGLTPPEIAAQTGRSESSIHGLHHRGRKALRKELLRLDAAPSIAASAA
jgi:RNA polymerase sigma-70 factor (ECF subfamily)